MVSPITHALTSLAKHFNTCYTKHFISHSLGESPKHQHQIHSNSLYTCSQITFGEIPSGRVRAWLLRGSPLLTGSVFLNLA